MKRNPYKKVTLKNVAVSAGVSPSTVSRAFNNPEIVDKETYSKIIYTANELGYVLPNNSSSVLNAPRTKKNVIALMIPNDDNPFYQSFISKFHKRINKIGYHTLLSVFNNEQESIDNQLRNLIDIQVDGCILAYMPSISNPGILNEFIKTIPSISFQSNIANIDSIDAEETDGTYSILESLVNAGHKNIAFVGYFSNLLVYEKRFEAYKKIHEDYGLTLRPEYISEYQGVSGQDMQAAYSEGCRLLSLPSPPTAIHCFNTKTAMGVYTAIRDKNLRIPDDISLSAYDDLPLCNVFTPPLSVVSQPLDSMISTGIDLLLRRIHNPDDEQQHVVFPTGIRMRESIGPHKV